MSQIDFIGSKISLVSKAQIRYEGILKEINSEDVTVSLSEVRSFGTESRPVSKYVPPRDDIFSTITFRGTDIEDLKVCQGPSDDLFHDPAIVTMSNQVKPGAKRTNERFSRDLQLSSPNYSEDPNSYVPHIYPHTFRNRHTNAGSINPPPGFSGDNFMPQQTITQHRPIPLIPSSHANNRSAKPLFDHSPGSNYIDGPNYRGFSRQSQFYSSMGHRPNWNNARGGYNNIQSSQNNYYRRRGFSMTGQGPNNRGGAPSMYDYNRNYGFQRPGAYRSSSTRAPREVFDKDYDFEAANTEMAELMKEINLNDEDDSEIRKAHSDDGTTHDATPSKSVNEKDLTIELDVKGKSSSGENNSGSDDEKPKSFFDSISSEALEKSKGARQGMMNRKDERRINLETFGGMAANQRLYQRNNGSIMNGMMRRGTGNYSFRRGNNSMYRGGGGYYNNNSRFYNGQYISSQGPQQQQRRYSNNTANVIKKYNNPRAPPPGVTVGGGSSGATGQPVDAMW